MRCFLLSVSFLLWVANPQRDDAQGGLNITLRFTTPLCDVRWNLFRSIYCFQGVTATCGCCMWFVLMSGWEPSTPAVAGCVAHSSTHPPPRVATTRRQLDSSQLPQWSPLSMSTDREHRAKVWIHRSPIKKVKKLFMQMIKIRKKYLKLNIFSHWLTWLIWC